MNSSYFSGLFFLHHGSPLAPQVTTTTASKCMSKEAKQAALARAKQWANDRRNRFNKEAQATMKKHSNKWAEDNDDNDNDNTYPFYRFLQRLDKKGAELNSSMEQVTARFCPKRLASG